MAIEIREFLPADYDPVMAVWQLADGVTIRDVDARGPLTTYLELHRGLCFVAVAGDEIVGAVLCGTDGRRGYLNHLAVAPEWRRRGIGRRLAERCVTALYERGIEKCHLMVKRENATGQTFWARLGWVSRDDVGLMSHTASQSANA
ncbi:MAG: GNAT family N-acetyltransferase [Gemmatimonadaceae bacterium]